VNGVTVESLTGFYRALNANGGRNAMVAVKREGSRITLPL